MRKNCVLAPQIADECSQPEMLRARSAVCADVKPLAATGRRSEGVNTKSLVSTFAAAVTRGAPSAAAVAALARRHRTSESVIWNRLFAAGAVNRRRVGGAFVYWPAIGLIDESSPRRVSVDSVRAATWQELIGWALLAGFCTSDQITSLRTDKDFFDFFGPFLARELGWKVQSGWSQRKVNEFLRPAVRNRAA